jgi:hypothetical protein
METANGDLLEFSRMDMEGAAFEAPSWSAKLNH